MHRIVAGVQGCYYVVTGLWALVDIDSFMAVTGPKLDIWLVKTVGVLVTVIGAVLLVAARRRSKELEVVLLAVGTAVGLAAIDGYYVSIGRISAIYLMDAVAEIVLIGAWFTLLLNRPRSV